MVLCSSAVVYKSRLGGEGTCKSRGLRNQREVPRNDGTRVPLTSDRVGVRLFREI